MDRNGNTYTFLYASVMVVAVAAILSAAAFNLKPYQKRNEEIEKMQNILASVGVETTPANAADIYKEKIVSTYVIDNSGNKKDGDAFNIDLKVEHAKAANEQSLPIFEAKVDGSTKYIIPLRGTGLWGPIWGYISVDSDKNTVYGAVFAHKGETPGLGAEIATGKFQAPFAGKKLFDSSSKLVSIIVAKSGEQAPAEHKVDGISGGTITSKALEKMLLDDLTNYEAFLSKK
ncbi:NADH:ubiquinone reductase (Na(+)-transporting) subunit C [Puteibacter caeruleilacunae]|nr:NADH:ubiquinone reductase (Na(+)-transporting) subunit C [Puteibacter caeruleilacunae]